MARWWLGFVCLALACAPGDIGGGGDADGGGGDLSGRPDAAVPPGGPDGGGGGGGGGAADAGGGGGQGGQLPDGPGVAVYWGQNGWGGAHPGDPASWEPPLADVCADPAYDVVILAFVTSFVSARNADGLPETNFSYHCETPWDPANPFLLRCPEIEAGVAACHERGKAVLLSLGGASGGYGFTDDAQAEAFAQTVWDIFLGGASEVRPFGAAVLDGVDLDLEGGSTTGYTAFVRRLDALATAGGGGTLITAAPQCPHPDAYLGPAPGRPLGDAPELFDALFVQFYNNWCAWSSPAAFAEAWTAWAALGPRVFVGLPATPEAANPASFVARAALPALLDVVRDDPAFGGIMLWDASFDRNSVEAGQTYGAFAAGLVGP